MPKSKLTIMQHSEAKAILMDAALLGEPVAIGARRGYPGMIVVAKKQHMGWGKTPVFYIKNWDESDRIARQMQGISALYMEVEPHEVTALMKGKNCYKVP